MKSVTRVNLILKHPCALHSVHMSSSFSLERFKIQLKLSISRLVFLQKKLTAQSLAARKEIADLLKANKTDQAITKVRYIVRDDFMVEAMEIVQSFCDDLLKSSNLIANTPTCDEFILEQAKSVIYASTRMDVPELLKVRDLLTAKYTKAIHPDREIGVYPRLVLKLSMSCPERGLCEKYLEAIAENFGIEWKSTEHESENELFIEEINEENLFIPTVNSSSHSSISSASSIESLTVASSLPPPPYAETMKPSPSAPLPMDYSKQQQQTLPDFDEFTRRFEALRKK